KPPVHCLPEVEFLSELRRLNGTPPEVLSQKGLMEILIPVLRADFAICETYSYSPEPPLNCPISAFGGWQDPDVKYDQLEAWRDHTRATFALRMFPGDHFFLHTAQPILLETLAQELHTHL